MLLRPNDISNQLELPGYNLSPRKVTKLLLSIIALLIVFNLIERVIVYSLNIDSDIQIISQYFNFDRESNIPSLYSALTLGFCSYLLAIISIFKKSKHARFAKHWKSLSYIFAFLAIDEACSIHESLIPIMRGIVNAEGFLYFPWVIPAFFMLIVFLLVFRKFIRALPTKTKTLFILSGFVYVAGALGMELIGGYLADVSGYNTAYGIASTIEELLEMLGIVLFINSLLSYIQSQLSEIRLSLSFFNN